MACQKLATFPLHSLYFPNSYLLKVMISWMLKLALKLVSET